MEPQTPESPISPGKARIEDLTITTQDRMVEMIRLYAADVQAAILLPIIVRKTRLGEGLHYSDPEFRDATRTETPNDGTLKVAVSRLKNVILRFQQEFGENLPFELTIEPFQEKGKATYRACFKATKPALRQRAENAESRVIELEDQLKAVSDRLEVADAEGGQPESGVPEPSGTLYQARRNEEQTIPPAPITQTNRSGRGQTVAGKWTRNPIGRILGVGAVLFVAAIGFVVAGPRSTVWANQLQRLWNPSSAASRPVTISIPPPPGGVFVFGNNVGGIALSPDGNRMAYVVWTDRSRLWVRGVDDSEGRNSVPLQETEGAAYPFWSPDSKWIGFFAEGKLKKVQLGGAKPEIICDVPIGRGGAWTDSGDIIFGSLLSGLKKVSDQGGQPTELTSLDRARGETGHSWPQALPRGHILYWVRSSKGEFQGAYAALLAKPKNPTLVKKTEANAVYAEDNEGRGHLLWLDDGVLHTDEFDLSTLRVAGRDQEIEPGISMIGLFGRANVAIPAKGLLLFANFNTFSQFRWFSGPDWKDKKAMFGNRDQYTAFRLSPNGRIAVSVDKPGGTNLLIDILNRPTPLVSDPGMNSYPVWSPDSRAIVYTNSNLNLYLRDVDDSGRSRQLTNSPNAQYPTDWSADGKWMLFWEVSHDKPQRQLWVLPMTEVGKSAPTARLYTLPSFGSASGSNEAWGRFCPENNPQWVIYQSDASHRNEIYAERFPQPAGRPILISKDGGEYPVCSPDGRQLFYLAPNNFLVRAQLTYSSDSIKASDWQDLFRLPAPDIGWPPYDLDRATGRILVRATPESPETLASTETENPGKPPLKLVINWTSLPWR